MCLNVHGRHAQKEVKRKHDVEQHPIFGMPNEQETDGRNAYVRAGKGGCGTLASGFGILYKMIKEAFVVSRTCLLYTSDAADE